MADDAIARLEAADLKAREFTITLGERSYTLRVPTRTQVRETLHRQGLMRHSYSNTVPLLLQTYLLRQALVGWTGVRMDDAVPGSGRDPLPWSERAAALVIEQRQADADQLTAALDERYLARETALAEDAKNSLPASSTPGGATQADLPPSD